MPDYDVTRVAGNIGALNALNSLNNINRQLATYQARLATGKRINSAADDPAGLTIATKMQARSEGMKVALSNIGDAKNLLAVAESGVSQINNILVQIRNKALSGASDTMGSEERAALKTQITEYQGQIDKIVAETKWNGNKLIGSATDLNFQTGADSGDTTTMSAVADLGSTALGVTTDVVTALTDQAGFNALLTVLDGSPGDPTADPVVPATTGAFALVSGEMSKIGAMEGRLTFKEDQVSAAQINVEGAYNRIMNANMAEEQVNASKFQILQQTATAMLAQANAAPQFLLTLFR
ncbi:MAG: flagellin [Chloroflexi bacterium]|nr:flagellin [Chloroflexota bacterium]